MGKEEMSDETTSFGDVQINLFSSFQGYMDSNKCIQELLKQLEASQSNVQRQSLCRAHVTANNPGRVTRTNSP
ncbi:hypothetical protein scyTo_0004890 [Scyliorhinus torazame]|uniref:Uncharacterized protein n=1 Tax=Scyliorhinus torazame TaxID=75743 RepID=A0A401NYS0_SCYTO|nr:hypothetical protein [Scyliorhinus torazame]